MDESYVKDYFSGEGTVTNWWEPEMGDKSHIFAREIELLSQMLDGEGSSNALDVACGKGRISRMLNARGLETTSLDISQEMLDVAYQRGDVTNPVVGDGENLEFDDNTFDVVSCMDALVHFPNPKKAIGESYRVLKNGGIYLCSTSNPYDLGVIPRKILKFIRNGRVREKGEGIFRYISPKEMKFILESQGYSIEEERRLGVLAPIKFRGRNGNSNSLFKDYLGSSV